MQEGKDVLSRAEAAAALYLIAPLFIFFAFFIRLEIAVLACVLIAWQMVEIVRHASWREPLGRRWMYFYFLALAMLWMWLSVGMRIENADWLKHYSVVNFLDRHAWPGHTHIAEFGDAVIRYSLGWYLIPAAVLKITDAHIQTGVLAAWSVLGIFLFFSLLPIQVGTTRKALIAAPLVFMVFGGADLIGTLLTRYQRGPPLHIEWWGSWIEFPASTTSLFWVPQHALSAWLGVALIMRSRQHAALLRYLILLVAAIALWSPFSAAGLVPFLLALLWQHGGGKMLWGWRQIASTLLLVVPLGLYLLAKSESIPTGFITDVPCITEHRDCFTWKSYFIFLLLEVGLLLAILFFWRQKEQGFLVAAALALCLIPLYRVGIYNDFAMRASLPALAVLAIFCAKAIVHAPRPYAWGALLVLLLALPTTGGEIYRVFMTGPAIRPDTTFDDPWAKKYLRQYFAPQPIWILRSRYVDPL